ncbi:fatty acid desaturase [Pacificoceanicola onchidii]|uniref:fatty acid desaturase n=1 Tax=Pacificoceanicola onchidii TaxID=2562685 RepID=UPI0010A5EA12|nr:fatty acid desaturase [Pacificoceanicola onchidii]
MTQKTTNDAPRSARDWVKVLAAYRDPSLGRSLFELAITLVPFLLLWALAWWALSFSYLLAFGLSVLNAGFLLRLFIIQHDCGHSAFFHSRTAGDWLGRALGVLTLTPYDVWRRTHSIHHSGAGNLSRRGLGDIHTMTVAEYKAETWRGRLMYRLYRSPVVLFGLGPFYIFFLQNRLPIGLTDGRQYWISAMATNVVLFLALGAIWWFGGWAPLLLIFVPSTLLAATLGIWLFYVQHQFETTHWDQDADWQLHEAALEGSSHYVMPKVLQWMTGNIGIHHVHHLYSRIPFYRLTEVLRDHEMLKDSNRMTIAESFANAKLHLWDEQSRRLLSFREARSLLA